jgi:hypothetical protein
LIQHHDQAKLFTNTQVQAQSLLVLLEHAKFWLLVAVAQAAVVMVVVVVLVVITTTHRPIYHQAVKP